MGLSRVQCTERTRPLIHLGVDQLAPVPTPRCQRGRDAGTSVDRTLPSSAEDSRAAGAVPVTACDGSAAAGRRACWPLLRLTRTGGALGLLRCPTWPACVRRCTSVGAKRTPATWNARRIQSTAWPTRRASSASPAALGQHRAHPGGEEDGRGGDRAEHRVEDERAGERSASRSPPRRPTGRAEVVPEEDDPVRPPATAATARQGRGRPARGGARSRRRTGVPKSQASARMVKTVRQAEACSSAAVPSTTTGRQEPRSSMSQRKRRAFRPTSRPDCPRNAPSRNGPPSQVRHTTPPTRSVCSTTRSSSGRRHDGPPPSRTSGGAEQQLGRDGAACPPPAVRGRRLDHRRTAPGRVKHGRGSPTASRTPTVLHSRNPTPGRGPAAQGAPPCGSQERPHGRGEELRSVEEPAGSAVARAGGGLERAGIVDRSAVERRRACRGGPRRSAPSRRAAGAGR